MAKNTSKGTDASTRAILEAAERIFGRHGYDGASMRLIAEEAGVAQALLHYHFKTKENLYRAVFERRASVVNAFRTRSIDELLARSQPIELEEVLSLLLTPVGDIFQGEAANIEMYIQMVAAVSLGKDELSRSIVEKNYDKAAGSFISAFKKAVPELSNDQAVWSYLYAIGARQQAQSSAYRASRLGAKPERGKAAAQMALDRLVRFVAAGIKGMIG